MSGPVIIPHLGATGGDVRIVAWLVREGDAVRAGTPLLLVETDKATVEVPAFADGTVTEIRAGVGEPCAPGDVVAMLGTAVAPAAAPPPAAEAAPDQAGGVVARLLQAFATMVLIRRYEDHLYQLFLQGLVPGTLHQCQGQEAVAVGVCSALRPEDLIFSTHRPVGHLIAKGASLEAISAELWGKATGCCGGKGGQMHLAAPEVGAMVTNAIVGANIPIATGAALGLALLGQDRVAVSFFGDGAANTGAFHEGLNLAAVKNAPVVFVCENNLYAASTPVAETMRLADVADRAAAYGMRGVVVDGMDVEAVFRAARTAVERARRGKGPTLIEAKTYRYRGHSRGDPCGYRDPAELAVWQARDPILRLRRRLLADLAVPVARLDAIEASQQARVEAAVAFALASPEPGAHALLENVRAA